MIVTGHQPQYLPYIGLFNKIAKSDIFLFTDNVQFLKESWQSRTIIKSPKDEILYLSINVKTKNRSTQLIKDVEVADLKWQKKHIQTIKQNYSKTQYFDEIFPILEKYYINEIKFLIDITIPLLIEMINLLKINVNIDYCSNLQIDGSKTTALIQKCIKTNSDTYLAGQGGKNYIDIQEFKKNNLNILFNNFVHPVYKQTGQKFLEGMAIIDLFFNEGIENSRKIFWDNINNKPKFESFSE
ncbi:MAG: WbqC family protein [Candidatus Kapabacteria bacterium]|nr:WbqC family protein [Candidatus Kapabacteria bacterium]